MTESLADTEATSRRIAIRARIARESAGLSQGHAARELGIGRSSLAEMEADNRKMSAAELCRMADIYSVAICGSRVARNSARVLVVTKELAAREPAGLDPEDLRTVLQLVKSIRGKGRLKSQVRGARPWAATAVRGSNV